LQPTLQLRNDTLEYWYVVTPHCAGNKLGNEAGNEVGNDAGIHNRVQTTSLLHFSSITVRKSVLCVAATSFSSANKKTNQRQYTIKPPFNNKKTSNRQGNSLGCMPTTGNVHIFSFALHSVSSLRTERESSNPVGVRMFRTVHSWGC